MKVITSLLLLAIGSAAELVSIAPFPGKNVLSSRRECGLANAVVNNKIYIFGGRYDIPYIVDPADYSSRYGRHRNTFNVSSEVHSYNMDTDEWEQLETTTPYPLKKAETQVVGDAVYFMNSGFDSNTTRSIDVWKYDTVNKTWDQVTRLGFVWLGNLRKYGKDGKIYITGSNDGLQINIIHIYDTISNAWLKPIVVNQQLRIYEIWCLDNGSLQVLAEPSNRLEETIVYDYAGGTHSVRHLNVYTIHSDGSVTQSDLVIDYHMIESVIVKDDVLYLLDSVNGQMFISSIDLNTHEKHELGSIGSRVYKPIFYPYGDAAFLLGGRAFTHLRSLEDKSEKIQTFMHKYMFDNNITV